MSNDPHGPKRTDPFAQRRDRFRGYESSAAVTAYLERLEREWPARATIADQIQRLIAQLDSPVPHLLELCCGPGRLAQTLLDAQPTLQYTGVDLSPPFLAHARQQLAEHAARVTLLPLDLSEPGWVEQVQAAAPFHAIVSLQSLHDVGDAGVIERLYAQAKTLLAAGGFCLNADLIVADGETLPDNPGRLTVSHHLQLLRAAGYVNVRCLSTPGGFGLVAGWRPAGESMQ